MKTFAQFLNLMEDIAPAGGPPPGPPGGGGGGPPPGPLGGGMGGPPPMGGGPPPMGGGPPGGAPGASQAPMQLKSTNVWDVLEKFLTVDGKS